MAKEIHDLVIVYEETRLPIKQLPADKTAVQVLGAVANKLNLPSTATGTLYHKVTGKKFSPNETLLDAGIENGDVLEVRFETPSFAEALGQAEFINNPEPRCPCILLLDTSGSMSEGNRIGSLNTGLKSFRDSLMADNLASLRVEVAIITFGSEVKSVQDFTTVNHFNPPNLVASGSTPMGAAINLALDKLQGRKKEYKKNGVAYYRPWIFLITDGEPTDDCQAAAKRMQEASDRKSVTFFAVGVEDANMQMLKQISPKQRAPLKLKGLKFGDMFEWLSTSLTSTSHSSVGDTVPLQSPLGWGEA
jgi:uncharacterized protein YegL